MKYIFVSILLSLGVMANSNYSKNDGESPPGTFTSSETTTTGTSIQGPKTLGTSEAPNSGMTQNRSNVSGPGTSAASMESNSAPVSSESGLTNSSGVTTDEMNTSPNQPPKSDSEVIEDSTLSSGEVYETGPYTREGTFDPRRPDEIQAQEEDALDYSTTPKKGPRLPAKDRK